MNCYFSQLPIELILEIFKYAKIEDIINFCEAYQRFECLFKAKCLTRHVDLVHLYKVDLDSFVKKIVPANVTSINLNGCHWLKADSLRDFISQLDNLKTLTALRTELDLSEKDIEVYNGTKIEKLALTLGQEDNLVKLVLRNIKELYLEVVAVNYFEFKFRNLVKLPKVEKYWIEYREYGPTIAIDRYLKNCDSAILQSLTFILKETNENLPRKLNMCDSFRKYYDTWRCYQTQISCYEKFDINKGRMLKWVGSEYFEIPYGPMDARSLCVGEVTSKTIKIKELNFDAMMDDGPEEKYRICRKVLKSCGKTVEKLAIPSYLLENSLAGCDFEDMKQIRHLELYGPFADNPNFLFVSQFTMLKFFYVEVPSLHDAIFLPVVFRNCPFLEILWIDIVEYSSCSLLTRLQEALKWSTNLKELTLQIWFDNAEIDDVIYVLANAKGIKLRKLSLLVKSTRRFKIDVWKHFFDNNEQLMYCFLEIKQLTVDYKKTAEELTKLYARPYRVLNICSDDLDINSEEMRNFRSTVCNVNIQNEFQLL